MNSIPQYVDSALRELERNGFEAYMVGGCVRDGLLNRRPGDWDIATNALPTDVCGIFKRVALTGLKHGTVTVLLGKSSIEVTTYRAEAEYTDGRRPDSVRFVPDLHTDLSRRDFTINAMAMDSSGALIDPFGGAEDIQGRLIRCVGDPCERFSEDALRMMRALRFAAVLGFRLSEDTERGISECSGRMALISAERVRDELLKIALTNRGYYIEKAIAFGLLDGFMTRAESLRLQRLNVLPRLKLQRTAGLCALLRAGGAVTDIESFLRKLRFDSKTVNAASKGIPLAEAGYDWDDFSIKKGLFENGFSTMTACAAAHTALYGGDRLKKLEGVIKSGQCFRISQLSIDGDDIKELGLSEGNAIGEILREILYYVISNPEDNKKEILLKIATEKIARLYSNLT